MVQIRTQARLNFGAAGNWNAIEARAKEFVRTWQGETYERGESQSFWTDFLAVFGINRKRAGAFFEYRTRKLSGAPGYVDLFYPGRLIAEQKSAGRNLDKAMEQALEYLPAMPDYELPRGVIVSDFRTFDLVMLDDSRQSISFTLEQFPSRIKHFSFLFDVDALALSEQHPVNVKAAQDISHLHQQIEKLGYRGEDLELLLTRIVFCLFAEDTGIFQPNQFSGYIRNFTRPDGSDLGRVLVEFFYVLDTAPEQRQQNLPHVLRAFPYVNGGLFSDLIAPPQMETEARRAILTASEQDWGLVNPSIFGSMFQGVMDEEGSDRRRNLGAHYTSEKNILRLIQPLFLEDLYAEFEAAKITKEKLEAFHDKIAELKFLDPACGSGNFLVITYRELRRLEHKVLQEMHKGQQFGLDMAHLIRVTPDQMTGIEIEEFPAKVAQLALWLTDHQMNREAADLFGGSIDLYARIPIKSQPNIVHDDALDLDWGKVVDLSDLDYIIGNPPFNGSKYMTPEMRHDLRGAFPPGLGSVGILDFVTAWYAKSAKVMHRNPKIRAALVSTNSITQGERVGVLWAHLLDQGIKIDFAHRTFQWRNEAPGVAAVFCVIIGFSKVKGIRPRLFDYPDIKDEPVEVVVRRINPYLVDGPNVVVTTRQQPLADAPTIGIGNKPIDDGNYLFTTAEKAAFIAREPNAAIYFRPYVGAQELIQGRERWCLWLGEAEEEKLVSMPAVAQRIENVREFRCKSKSTPTQELAKRPTRFHVENMPLEQFLYIPRVSSENRDYVPIGFMAPETIASDAGHILPNATLYHFGILTSQMHMAWMRLVAGRLEGRYRYSKDIVYNNFPWPENVTEAQGIYIERLTQAVLDARAEHPLRTLGSLYDPPKMPYNLMQAHKALDIAVDKLYRRSPFEDDAERVAYLLRRYQRLASI